jgi:Uma2 family endonuclease
VRLEAHVRRYNMGRVVVSPIDVILDRDRALIVQPDLVFVAAARSHICTDRIWGAPDLAIEVLSTSNRRHDRTVKVGWYREYGVRECWVVDPISCQIGVVDLAAPEVRSHVFEARQIVRSSVLPRLRLRPADVFSA